MCVCVCVCVYVTTKPVLSVNFSQLQFIHKLKAD